MQGQNHIKFVHYKLYIYIKIEGYHFSCTKRSIDTRYGLDKKMHTGVPSKQDSTKYDLYLCHISLTVTQLNDNKTIHA